MDPHADRVYEWEDEWADWNRHTLSLADVRRHVWVACDRYGIKPFPRVKMHPGRAMAYTMGSLISFPRWCMNAPIALHEAAHYITDKLHPRAADHGPTWLGVYLWLLETAAVAPPEALHATMRKHGLRWRVRPPRR